MRRKLRITSVLDGAENDLLNWRRQAGGIQEGKGVKRDIEKPKPVWKHSMR